MCKKFLQCSWKSNAFMKFFIVHHQNLNIEDMTTWPPPSSSHGAAAVQNNVIASAVRTGQISAQPGAMEVSIVIVSIAFNTIHMCLVISAAFFPIWGLLLSW